MMNYRKISLCLISLQDMINHMVNHISVSYTHLTLPTT